RRSAATGGKAEFFYMLNELRNQRRDTLSRMNARDRVCDKLAERQDGDFDAFALHEFRVVADGIRDDELVNGAFVETLDDRLGGTGKDRVRRKAQNSFRSCFFRCFSVGYHRAA